MAGNAVTRNSQESRISEDDSHNKAKLEAGRRSLEETLRDLLGEKASVFHSALLDKLYKRVESYSAQADFEEEKQFDAEFEHQAWTLTPSSSLGGLVQCQPCHLRVSNSYALS